MSNTLKEIAISLSTKQSHYVNHLTEESPILDNMRFEPSTHGLWNAYEEVASIDGPAFIDINQPLPEMKVDSNLKKSTSRFWVAKSFCRKTKARWLVLPNILTRRPMCS